MGLCGLFASNYPQRVSLMPRELPYQKTHTTDSHKTRSGLPPTGDYVKVSIHERQSDLYAKGGHPPGSSAPHQHSYLRVVLWLKHFRRTRFWDRIKKKIEKIESETKFMQLLRSAILQPTCKYCGDNYWSFNWKSFVKIRQNFILSFFVVKNELRKVFCEIKSVNLYTHIFNI